MIPLHVVAYVPGAVCVPAHGVALDALLMAAVAVRDGLPPADVEQHAIAIPVAQERGLYLATTSQYEWEERDRHWLHRRFPVHEAQALAEPRFRRIRLSAGATKSYRIPYEVGYLRDGCMDWWCIGDMDAVREMLPSVTHVGKKRAVGKGEVREWRVERCEPWAGFPVVRDGKPLRPLPLDWPGVRAADREMRVLTPPYWQRWREEEALV